MNESDWSSYPSEDPSSLSLIGMLSSFIFKYLIYIQNSGVLGFWGVDIPDSYKVGHEAHFGQVTEKYLDYLSKGTLPEWEIPNMIVKYYTTTEGLKQAFDMN